MSNFKYTKNDNYFSDLSLQSSYWAGFIAADGCIYKNRLTIGLAYSDIDHLNKFISDIGWTGKVVKEFSKRNSKISEIAKVYICNSRKYLEDLYQIYNITTNKSFTLKPPRGLANKNRDAFLIGYIDGDGYLKEINNNYGANKIIRFSLGSASQDMVYWIRDLVFEINGLEAHNKEKNIFTYDDGFKLFTIAGKKVVSLLNYLDYVDVYRLKRKWEFNAMEGRIKDSNEYVDTEEVA